MQQIVVCLSHQNALRAGHVISSVWGGEGGGEEGSLADKSFFVQMYQTIDLFMT
jgi:hypothetical protein